MFKKITAMLMVICLSAGIGYAAGTGTNITVYYDTIKKIMIDGTDKTPADVKPFIYNGTTYVPLRYISEQLGKPVYFDKATQYIYIGNRPVSQSIEEKSLFSVPSGGLFNVFLYRYDNSEKAEYNLDLDAQFNYPQNFKMSFKTSAQSDLNTYEYFDKGLNLQVSAGDNALFYKLDNNYDSLKGRIGFDGKLQTKFYPTTIKVIVDDVVRDEIRLTDSNRDAIINTSLTGGKNLKLQFVVDNYNSSMETYLNLIDMKVEKYTIQ